MITLFSSQGDFCATAKIPLERLFVVPGNHDVDLNIEVNVSNFEDQNYERLSAALLAQPMPEVLRRQCAYAEFVMDFFKTPEASWQLEPNGYWCIRMVPLTNGTLSVICLNF